MISPLGKLRKLGLNKGEPEQDWDHHILVHMDGLTQAAKDMKDMRACYDALLSAAAASVNSAYEFSESLMEMGNCLLEKNAMHDNVDRGGPLSLLGRVQLELQKLVDSYRSHIIMAITHPSESLLSELRKVEEMKLQCDEKREIFEYMLGQYKEKRKSKHAKGETFTSYQLQAVRDDYDEAARLYIFRVESLKQGQCRSLLTQAARHHAAQMNFFRKGRQSLEAIDPHIRNITEKQHIDFELSDVNDGGSFETNDDGELSFDYSINKKEFENSTTSRNSMEKNLVSSSSPQIQSDRQMAYHNPPGHPHPQPAPPHGHGGSYQGYFDRSRGHGHGYAPPPPQPPPSYNHPHDHHSASGCSSFLKGCLGALCCCCVLEQCCF